jgi:hypothetical protein
MADIKQKNSKESRDGVLQKLQMMFLTKDRKEKYKAGIRKSAFSLIEKEKKWGEEHTSGWGSTVAYTKNTRAIIENIIRDYGITSMYDAACGDFVWMPLVLKNLPDDFKYIGGDIVPALISSHTEKYPQYEFRNIDFVYDEIPKCDLIFCRDALQHLPVEDIKIALNKFLNSGAKYLLATTHLRRYGWKNGENIKMAKCRDRNLMLRPFNLHDPLVVYSEQDESHKFLGLWKLR